MKKFISIIAVSLFVISGTAYSAEAKLEATVGSGAVALDIKYKPQKVVYDVNVNTLRAMNGVLDRASYLSKLTGADPFDSSIVLVLHGGEIPFFARKNYQQYKELIIRARSLVKGETLKIRMCKIAAEAHGFEPKQIHGFVEIVPMGDAEIIRLQNEENHAYMQ